MQRVLRRLPRQVTLHWMSKARRCHAAPGFSFASVSKQETQLFQQYSEQPGNAHENRGQHNGRQHIGHLDLGDLQQIQAQTDD
jgi:hypothetical protein